MPEKVLNALLLSSLVFIYNIALIAKQNYRSGTRPYYKGFIDTH